MSIISSNNAPFADLRLQIEHLDPRTLTPATNRTRRHSKVKIRKLARSILDHGLLLPLRVNAESRVIGGHALLEAALSLELTLVPIVRITHLSEAEERLYAIAENKLAEGSVWDHEKLRIEFEQIQILSPSIELKRSGFEIAERDIIIGHARTEELCDLDDVSAPAQSGPAVSRVDDLFQLGRHRLLCGDSTRAGSVALVCGERRVRAVVSDPPFNVKITGHVSGLGKNKHREFVAASGEQSRPEFTNFLARAMAATKANLVSGALLYLFMDWRHMAELLSAAEQEQLTQLNLLVWAKTNAGMGSHYRSAHELIGLFKHGNEPHTNNVQLGAYGRNRTNVLHYPGMNTFTKGRSKALESHPTVKPTALIADLILDSSAPGDLVLDSFGGSGTTLIAAEKTDRDSALIELDPLYVDVIINRWQEATGETAILLSTNQSFAELAAARAEEMCDAA